MKLKNQNKRNLGGDFGKKKKTMIRILIDELGTGHEDIFLKIGALTSFSKRADMYYMTDFLKLDPTKIKRIPQDIGIAYINYMKEQFANLNENEKFVVFDLSDQYVGGLAISKHKKELLKVSYVWTGQITGYSVDKDCIEDAFNNTKAEFSTEFEWLLSQNSILENLNWSINKING